MTPRTSRLAALLLAATFACGAQAPPSAGEAGTLRGAGLEAGDPGDGATSAEDAPQLAAMQAASRHYYTRVAEMLAASGKPRELAFAATLLEAAGAVPQAEMVIAGDSPSQAVSRDPRAAQWRRLASARAGADVVANALLLQGDDAAEATYRQSIERWRRLEPDNLAPGLLGNAPADDWLPQAGSYRRFDWHYYELLRWMQATLAAHPLVAEERVMQDGNELPPDQAAAITAVGIQMATAMPNLTTLLSACKATELDSAPTRRGDCRQVGQVMADASDTRLGTAIGIALLRRTATTPAQREDALARQRRNDWQMWQWGRLASAGPDDGAGQFTRILLDPSVRSEQDAAARVLAEAGVPPEPPAGWRSPWPHDDAGG